MGAKVVHDLCVAWCNLTRRILRLLVYGPVPLFPVSNRGSPIGGPGAGENHRPSSGHRSRGGLREFDG
jgi:hypothetical protein